MVNLIINVFVIIFDCPEKCSTVSCDTDSQCLQHNYASLYYNTLQAAWAGDLKQTATAILATYFKFLG